MPDGLDYRCGGSAGLAPASHYSATGGNVGGALDPCQEIARSGCRWRLRGLPDLAGFRELFQAFHLVAQDLVDERRDGVESLRIVAAEVVDEHELRARVLRGE